MKKRGESKAWGGVKGKTCLKLEKTKVQNKEFLNKNYFFDGRLMNQHINYTTCNIKCYGQF